MVYRVLARCAVSSSHRKVKISDFEEDRLFLGWPNLTLKDRKMIESRRLDRIGWDRDTTGSPPSTCLIRTCSLVGASASTFVRETGSCSYVSIAKTVRTSSRRGNLF